jgi:very-short-patch-repair endonuclease
MISANVLYSSFSIQHSLFILQHSSFILALLAGLVVEVDGDVHDLQKEEDERREKVLSALGLRVVRFGNDEVMRDAERSALVGKIKGLILAWRKSAHVTPCSLARMI